MFSLVLECYRLVYLYALRCGGSLYFDCGYLCKHQIFLSLCFVAPCFLDVGDTNGACLARGDHYRHLLLELDRVRMLNQITREIRQSQL